MISETKFELFCCSLKKCFEFNLKRKMEFAKFHSENGWQCLPGSAVHCFGNSARDALQNNVIEKTSLFFTNLLQNKEHLVDLPFALLFQVVFSGILSSSFFNIFSRFTPEKRRARDKSGLRT